MIFPFPEFCAQLSGYLLQILTKQPVLFRVIPYAKYPHHKLPVPLL